MSTLLPDDCNSLKDLRDFLVSVVIPDVFFSQYGVDFPAVVFGFVDVFKGYTIDPSVSVAFVVLGGQDIYIIGELVDLFDQLLFIHEGGSFDSL